MLQEPSLRRKRVSISFFHPFYYNNSLSEVVDDETNKCLLLAGVVLDICKDIPAWPGRHLLEGGEHRRYFGLKTVARGVIEFECKNQREYDVWTQGVTRLLRIVEDKKR